MPQPDTLASTIRAVRRFNEDLMKGRIDPEGEEPPPIPLKKKTGISMEMYMIQI